MLNTDCYDQGEAEGLSRTETEFLLLIGRRATRRFRVVSIADSRYSDDHESYNVIKTAISVFQSFLPIGTTPEEITKMLMRFESFGIVSLHKAPLSGTAILLTENGAALIRRIYPHEFNEEVTYGAFSKSPPL